MHTRAHLVVVMLVFMLVDKVVAVEVVDVLTQLWVGIDGDYGPNDASGHVIWACFVATPLPCE